MVYRPMQAILIWIEHAKKLGRNIAHLVLECAYFHSTPSPIALFFIVPLLPQRSVPFPAFSYNAYFHSVYSPTALIVTILL
jgi:hypothetical protein